MKTVLFSPWRALACGAATCVAFCVWPGPAAVRAQTSTWTGAVDNSWGTPGNWNHAPAFDGTDQLILGSLAHPGQVLGADRAIHTLTFGQGGFTVTGNSLSLYGSGAGIVSTGNNTVGSDLYPQVPVTYQSSAGTLTFAGTVSANSGSYPAPPPAPTLTGAGNFIISGSVQGQGPLVMNGTGMLLISGLVYNGGGLTVNAGTLRVAAADTLSASGVSLGAGGTFDLNGLDVNMTSMGGAGTVLLGNNTLTITSGGDIVYPPHFTGAIRGSGGLVFRLAAGNRFDLGGNNTYSGGTTVKQGFLTCSADANLGAPDGRFTLDGGGIKFSQNGTLTRPVVIGSGGATFSTDPRTVSYLPSVMTGTGPVTYGYDTEGEGTWVASGSYAYTGSTTIRTGNLAITSSAQLGAGTSAVTTTQGSLLLRGGITVPGRTITISGYGNGTNDSLGALVSDTGANAWTGPVVVVGAFGFVGVASGSTLTLSGAISGGGTLYLNGVGDTLVSGTVGTTIDKYYGGTLTLSGKNGAYGLVVSGGTAVLAGASAVTGTGGITLASSATLRLGTNQALSTVSDYGLAGATVDLGGYDLTLTRGGSLAGTITGSGRVFMEGTGTLSLTGANTFTGGLYIDNGTLAAGSDASLGAAGSPVVFRGGTLQVYGGTYPAAGRPLTFSAGVSLNVASGTFTLAQALANTGGLNKLGAGTLVLTGANSYTGGTILSAGTLSVSSDAALGAGSGALSLQGGTLQVTGNTFHSTARPINSGTASSGFDIADPANTFTLGAITGSAGGITKLGAGTLVLAGQTPVSTVNANAGTLRLGAANVLAANSFIGVATGAAFDLAGFDQTAATVGVSGTLTTGAGTLSVSGAISGDTPGGVIAGRLALTGGNVTIYSSYGTAPGALTVAAAVSGSGTLTTRGTGTLVFTGDNPFAGALMVDAGTLSLTGALLHASGVTVAQGARLDVADGRLGVNGDLTNGGFLRLTGSATFAASGVITNNGVLDISQWNGALPANLVNGKGGVVLDAAGLRIAQIARSSTAVQVTVNGLAGLSYQLQRATSLTAADWQPVSASSVPQPATADGPLVLTDGNPPTAAQGFYRVIVSQTTGSSGH